MSGSSDLKIPWAADLAGCDRTIERKSDSASGRNTKQANVPRVAGHVSDLHAVKLEPVSPKEGSKL